MHRGLSFPKENIVFTMLIGQAFARLKLKQIGCTLKQLDARGEIEISPSVYLAVLVGRGTRSYRLRDHTGNDGCGLEDHVPARLRPMLPCLHGTANRQYSKDAVSARQEDDRRQARFRELLLA